jgi:hypothetical protein
MKIFYICDGEGPAYFELDDLIDNFLTSEAEVNVTDMRHDVENRGWYHAVHENGEFLVLDPARFQLTLTPEGWDSLMSNGGFK